MSLVEIMERLPTQESCSEFLEGIRFKEGIEIKLSVLGCKSRYFNVLNC